MLRVVLCGPYPVDPSLRPGGVISATIYLAQGLRRRKDIELHIVAPTRDLQRDEVRKEQGATVHYLAANRRRIVPNLISGIGRVQRKIRDIKPDVVHSEIPLGALAGLKAGCPTVQTIHGISHMEVRYAPNFTRRAAVWLEGYLGRASVRKVRHAIPTSQYAADAYAGMTSAKMHLIYNPIDDAFFECPNLEEPGRLLFGGNVIERKNVLGHLEVVRRLRKKYPHLTLRIAGGTPEAAYLEQCRTFVSTHGLESNVVFLGAAPIAKMLEEHSRAAMLVLFSKQETAPLVISEALCAGKPVVASTAGGNAELVLHGGTGYVADWDDSDSLEKYVDGLLADDSLRKAMGAAAREDARRRFSIDAVTEQTVRVYEEVVANP